MGWIKGLLAEFQTLITTIFILVAGGVAVKLIWERKMIAVILFVFVVAIGGWFVIDGKGAITTLSKMFSSIQAK